LFFPLASWREGDGGAQKRVDCGSHFDNSIKINKLSVEAENGSNPDRKRSTTVVDILVEIQKKLHYRQKASLVMARSNGSGR